MFLDAPYFMASTYNISSFYIFSLKTFWYVASWNALFNIFRKEWHEVKYTRYPAIVPKRNTFRRVGITIHVNIFCEEELTSCSHTKQVGRSLKMLSMWILAWYAFNNNELGYYLNDAIWRTAFMFERLDINIWSCYFFHVMTKCYITLFIPSTLL